MAWAAVSWAYKDLISSAKLAQMVENLRVHDHVSTDQGAPLGLWTPYTPTLTNYSGGGTNASVGNGVMTARYMRINKFVAIFWQLQFGTTTTLGTNGAYLTGLHPFAEAYRRHYAVDGFGPGGALGRWHAAHDDVGHVLMQSAGVYLQDQPVGNGTRAVLQISGLYEVA